MNDLQKHRDLRSSIMHNKPTTELERKVLVQIDRKRRHLCRIRWAAGIAWVLLVGVLVVGGIVESVSGKTPISSTLAMIGMGTFWIALFLTASWYVRYVSCQFDSIQQALAAIQERLDNSVSGDTGQ